MPRLRSGVRLTLFLPANDRLERRAARESITEMQTRFGGATRTNLAPPPLRGYWFDSETGTLYVDRIAVVFSDVEAVMSDALLEETGVLHAFALARYSDAGRTQLEIWFTVQPLERVSQR